jgi:hypothetical protein
MDDTGLEWNEWFAIEIGELAESDEVWWHAKVAVDATSDEDWWVLDWMLDQPRCTKAVAARIFWWADPLGQAQAMLLRGAVLEPGVGEYEAILDKCLRYSREGRFVDGGIGFDEGRGAAYRAFLAAHRPKPDPLDVPDALLDDVAGRCLAFAFEDGPDVGTKTLRARYRDALPDEPPIAAGKVPDGERAKIEALEAFEEQWQRDRASDPQPISAAVPDVTTSKQEPVYGLGIALLAFSLGGLALLGWLKGWF